MADDQKSLSSEKQVRLMMWTVPRSTSTVLSKCLSFVEDSKVFFEPYTCAYHLGPEKVVFEIPNYVDETLEKEFEDPSPDDASPESTMGFDVSGCTYKWVKEQLEQAHTGKRLVFCKDMTYSVTTHEDFLPSGYQHLFLLRHPLKVFPSWKKMYQFAIKVPMDEYSLDKLPHGVFPKGYGFKDMSDLMDHLKEVHDQEVIIIDSDDLLANPKGTLSALFKAIGLPFDEKILDWEAGDAISKQWVASKVLLKVNNIGQYYKNAFASTCFLKPGDLPDRSSLSPDILRCVDASMPYYDKMYAQRLKPQEN